MWAIQFLGSNVLYKRGYSLYKSSKQREYITIDSKPKLTASRNRSYNAIYPQRACAIELPHSCWLVTGIWQSTLSLQGIGTEAGFAVWVRSQRFFSLMAFNSVWAFILVAKVVQLSHQVVAVIWLHWDFSLRSCNRCAVQHRYFQVFAWGR